MISCGMLLMSLVVIPIAWKITCYIGCILKAYYRYNVNSIVYEVIPREANDDYRK